MIKKACYDKLSKLNVERESNFELLHIFLMTIIVLHHFSIYSGFLMGGGKPRLHFNSVNMWRDRC